MNSYGCGIANIVYKVISFIHIGIKPGCKKGWADFKGTGHDTQREGAPRTIISVTGTFGIPFPRMFYIVCPFRTLSRHELKKKQC